MVVMAITMVLSAALANPDARAQPAPDARAQPDPDARVHFNGALFKLIYGKRRRG